ncbi:unnamed protein product [Ilex paraguariensis]|uniref:Secreted protein n=1 Tax=Ilex paraguariensis TaxID=185542 RepID=A0ABC8RHJ2_9AQUA
MLFSWCYGVDVAGMRGCSAVRMLCCCSSCCRLVSVLLLVWKLKSCCQGSVQLMNAMLLDDKRSVLAFGQLLFPAIFVVEADSWLQLEGVVLMNAGFAGID